MLPPELECPCPRPFALELKPEPDEPRNSTRSCCCSGKRGEIGDFEELPFRTVLLSDEIKVDVASDCSSVTEGDTSEAIDDEELVSGRTDDEDVDRSVSCRPLVSSNTSGRFRNDELRGGGLIGP